MAISDGMIIKLVCEFPIAGVGNLQNRFTWKYQGADYTEAGLIAALTGWAEDFYELAANCMPSAVTSFNTYLDEMEWDAIEEKWVTKRNIGVSSGSVTFTDTSDILPFQCAPCLVAYTERPKSRGRKFLPLWCEDTQQSSSIVAGFQDELAAMLAEYLATFVIETGKAVAPGVMSEVEGVFLPFLSGIVNTLIFTQRRRTPGVGG